MTPDERAARLHLTAAAESLRVAGERLCDWLEATGQDVAGNGHVASADEAAGSLREAPTAPVSSSALAADLQDLAPPITPEGLATWASTMMGGDTSHMLDDAPVPPPIPLGAVVTVTVNGVEWQREDGEWDDAEGGGPPNKADALDFLDRIAADARVIADLRDDVAEWEATCRVVEEERDEARRALDDVRLELNEEHFTAEQRTMHALRVIQAATSQGLGAATPNSEGATNPSPAPASAPCGHTNTSPSPDSPHARVAAPRRWWLRRRSDAGWPDAHAYLSEEMARSARYGPTGGGWSDVVPVIEARVTRATVERVAHALHEEDVRRHWMEHEWSASSPAVRARKLQLARAALTALGLTVEDDHA